MLSKGSLLKIAKSHIDFNIDLLIQMLAPEDSNAIMCKHTIRGVNCLLKIAKLHIYFRLIKSNAV